MRPPEFRQHSRDLPPAAPCTSPAQGLPDFFELPRYSESVDFHGEVLHNFPIHRTRQLHFNDQTEIQEVEEVKSPEYIDIHIPVKSVKVGPRESLFQDAYIPVEVMNKQNEDEQREAKEMSDGNGKVPGLSGAPPDVAGTGPVPEDGPTPRSTRCSPTRLSKTLR